MRFLHTQESKWHTTRHALSTIAWSRVSVYLLVLCIALANLERFVAPETSSTTSKRFVVLVGPNGAGKTTIVRSLLRDNGHLHTASRYYCRKPRADETNGTMNVFLSVPEFNAKASHEGTMLVMDSHLMVTEDGSMIPSQSGVDLAEIEAAAVNRRFVLDFHAKHVLAWRNTKYFASTIIICILPANLDTLQQRLLQRHALQPQIARAYMTNVEQELQTLREEQVCQYEVVNEKLNETMVQVKKLVDVEVNHEH